MPPVRSCFQVAASVIGILVLGVGLGEVLVHRLAPNSMLAVLIGFMTFPLIFGGGYKTWQAHVVAIAIPGPFACGESEVRTTHGVRVR